MKKIAVLLTGAVLFLTACGDGSTNDVEHKNSGDEQIRGPVMNSGTETEMQRATDAVRDSLIKEDSGALTLPH